LRVPVVWNRDDIELDASIVAADEHQLVAIGVHDWIAGVDIAAKMRAFPIRCFRPDLATLTRMT
jgi:hypothetical protein